LSDFSVTIYEVVPQPDAGSDSDAGGQTV